MKCQACAKAKGGRCWQHPATEDELIEERLIAGKDEFAGRYKDQWRGR